ncbi:MAG: BLUF domain-containing protein [Verrucomicrobiota bacterium]
MYVSTANAVLTEEALLELLARTQYRNAVKNITGLLLHSDGNIIQVIEGPKETVVELYNKIEADSRHRGVTLLSSRAIERRDFPNYKMGFKRAQPKDFHDNLPGFTDMVENQNFSEEQFAGLSKIVATFIRTFAKTTNIDRFGT